MTDIGDAIRKGEALLDAAKQLRCTPALRASIASGMFQTPEWLYSAFRVDCGRDGRGLIHHRPRISNALGRRQHHGRNTV